MRNIKTFYIFLLLFFAHFSDADTRFKDENSNSFSDTNMLYDKNYPLTLTGDGDKNYPLTLTGDGDKNYPLTLTGDDGFSGNSEQIKESNSNDIFKFDSSKPAQGTSSNAQEKYTIIIASVIGGSVLILVIVIFLIWYRKRKLAIESSKILGPSSEETQIHEYPENIDDHLNHVYNVHSNQGLCDNYSHMNDHKHVSRTNSDVITEYSGEYSVSNNLERISSLKITKESLQSQRLSPFLPESTSIQSFTESSFNYPRQETPSYHAASTPASCTSNRALPDIPSDLYPAYAQSRRTAMISPTCSQSAYPHIHSYNPQSIVSDSTPDSKRTSSESLALYLAIDMI